MGTANGRHAGRACHSRDDAQGGQLVAGPRHEHARQRRTSVIMHALLPHGDAELAPFRYDSTVPGCMARPCRLQSRRRPGSYGRDTGHVAAACRRSTRMPRRRPLPRDAARRTAGRDRLAGRGHELRGHAATARCRRATQVRGARRSGRRAARGHHRHPGPRTRGHRHRPREQYHDHRGRTRPVLQHDESRTTAGSTSIARLRCPNTGRCLCSTAR